MLRIRNATKKTAVAALALLLCALPLSYLSVSAAAVDFSDYKAGTYDVTASLSCYVPAMGGVEFGAPLLTRATVTVGEDKSSFMTLYFTKSSITIYSITCDTFIDPSPPSPDSSRGVLSGTIGYYDAGGALRTDGVTYSLSSGTALNSAGDAVNYVGSITFPLDRAADTYHLAMYINSNVMGVQFCNGSAAATETTYPAVLSVRWPEAQDGAAGPDEAAAETKAEDAAEAPVSSAGGSAGAPGSSAGGAAEAPVSSAGGAAEAPGDSAGGAAEPAAQIAPESAASGPDDSGGAVSKDGLNIYYADGGQQIADDEVPLGDFDTGAAPDSLAGDDAAYSSLNMRAIKILAVCAATLIAAGAALIFGAKFTISRRGTE